MAVASRRRSIIKTLSYRAVVTVILAIVTFVFTGNLYQTSTIAIVFGIFATAAYYLHERLWSKINWRWVPNHISKSLANCSILPIPVTRTVAAPFSLAISKAFILKVLVPRCENTTTISFFDNTYFDLTKSKLWRGDGVIAALVL